MTVPAGRSTRWIRTTLLSAALAGIATSSPLARAQPAPAPPAPSPTAPATPTGPFDISARVRDSLELDVATLRQGNSPAEREEAARRLIARQSAEADTRLRQVANDPAANVAAQVAIARAVTDDPTPDPALVRMFAGLLGQEATITQAGATALAGYRDNPEALQAVIGFVQRNQPGNSGVRAAAVRGLAASIEPAAAQALVTLLNDPNQPGVVRDAAGDALGDMTLLRENGRDPAAWDAWWKTNGPPAKTAVQFKSDLLDRFKRTRGKPASDAESLIQDLYRFVPREQRPDFLRRALAATDPVYRAAAVVVARKDAETTGQPAQVVITRIRAMIADSSPDVRLQSAAMVGSINDAGSLELILTQLAQEPDAGVRIAIINAVVPMRDARAVPELLKALDDPSMAVAIAAAGAIRQMGPVVKQDPQLAQRVRAALVKTMNGRGKAADGVDLRAAAIEALSSLGDAALGQMFLNLLNPNGNEPPRVRRAAYKGLEELGDPKNTDIVIRFLATERDAGVRLAALDTLGKISQFTAAAPTLYGIFNNGNAEPDQSVRERAWQVFERLLPSATPNELRDWSGRTFQADAPRRLSVLKELAVRYAAQAEQLAAQGQPGPAAQTRDALATTWENIGDAYLKIAKDRKAPVSAEAARNFRLALDYWLANNGAPVTIAGLTRELTQALLGSRQYDAAARFAAESLTRNIPDGISILTNEAESLVQAGDFAAAQSLADEAMKVQPLAESRFGRRLSEARDQAKNALKNTPTPR